MKRLTVALGVVVVAMFAGAAWSVSTGFFEVNTVEQIRKGKLDGAVLTEPGTLTLGFEKKEILKADGEVVWSVAVDPAGAVYAGTSQKGNLYVIRDGKSSVFHAVDDTALFAVAVGPDGKAYYAGGPGGNVYRDGKVFCKLTQSYVWALLFDDHGGLYAATGPIGKVFRIDAAGTAVQVLETPDPHVLCLARDSKGNVYAGTSKSGLIYQIPPAGAARVVYDAAESEIRCLAVDEKDNVYFGTADVQPGRAGSRTMGPRPSRPMPGPASGGVSGPASGDAEGGTMPSAAPAPIRDEVTAINSVYRLAPDGSVVQLYSIRGKMILSMVSMGTDLYVGTGNRGDLLRIDENLDTTTLENDLEKQVVCLAKGRNGELLMGAGDQGRVILYAQDFMKDGQYMSDVFDAKFPARFGAVTWTGKTPPGTAVEITTQSGNVAEPDASWSEWSKPYPASGATVASPTARFIRYKLKLKAVLPKAAPTVEHVRIAYLTSNQPPRVKAIKVATPEDKGVKPGPAAQVDVSWQAEDPNGDRMQYKLEFRMRGETTWRVLEEKTDKAAYTWKTDAVPDGTYEVRVTASDSPDNPKDAALSHSRVSEAFVIDNTRPTVAITVRPGDLKSGKAAVDVVLSDATSIIRSAEYSVDSGDWQAFFPDDRIFDSTTEKATLSLEGLKDGEHTITVRATDAGGNVGAGSRTFTTK